MKYEGKLVVKCVITITGAVENCRVIRPAKPSQLDTEIAHLLHDWRYHPATRDGVPVETEYVFRLNFEAPPSLSGFPPRR